VAIGPAAARPSARAARAAYKDACLVTVNDPSHNNDDANFAGDATAMSKFANDYGFGGTATAGSAAELEAEVARLVKNGCKDVVVLVAGHGAPAEGPGATSEPTVVVESHVTPDGGQETVIDQAITLPDLQGLVSKFDPKPKEEPGKPTPTPLMAEPQATAVPPPCADGSANEQVGNQAQASPMTPGSSSARSSRSSRRCRSDGSLGRAGCQSVTAR
jgi:hypothetical protein